MATDRKPGNRRPTASGADSNHLRGERELQAGLSFETYLRCLWLLELRGRAGFVALDQGEDLSLHLPLGKVVYRQVKKRDAGYWRASDRGLSDYIKRAYNRYRSDRRVAHEFYTDAVVESGLTTSEGAKTRLNPLAPKVQKLAPEETEGFCSAFRIIRQERPLTPEAMSDLLFGEMCRAVLDASDDSDISRQINVHEVKLLVFSLIRVEQAFRYGQVPLTWADVDREIEFDAFVERLRAKVSGGGIFVPWTADIPNESDASQILRSISKGLSIPRNAIEDVLYPLLDKYIVDHTPPRKSSKRTLFFISGQSGSGKSWSLVRCGAYLRERHPGVCVWVAQDWSPLDGNFQVSFDPLVLHAVLIDNATANEWDNILQRSASSLILPFNVFFIVADFAHNVRHLASRLNAAKVTAKVPVGFTSSEIILLSTTLRAFPPSNSELDLCSKTNARRAVALLRGVVSEQPSAEIANLLIDAGALLIVLSCSSVGVAVPEELVEHAVGRALKPEEHAYLVRVRKHGRMYLSFEDAGTAKRLLGSAFGATVERRIDETIGTLIDSSDGQDLAHRGFLRQILHRVPQRMFITLIRIYPEKIREILSKEDIYPIAFTWFPLFHNAGEEEFTSAILHRYVDVPANLHDFAAWIELWSPVARAPYISKRLGGMSRVEPWQLQTLAEIISRIPADENRRDIAERFCSILLNLVPDAVRRCFQYGNAFSIFTKLVADNGSPDDRRDAVDVVEGLISHRLSAGQINQAWIEGYSDLWMRNARQARARLSIEIAVEMIRKFQAGTVPEEQTFLAGQLSRRYGELVREESSRDVKLIRALLDHVLTTLTGTHRNVALPSNLLQRVVESGTDEEWEDAFSKYISALRMLGDRGIPLDRISPLLLPIFRTVTVRGGDYEARFVREAIQWLPGTGRVRTMETGKLTWCLLRSIARLAEVGEPLKASIRSAYIDVLSARVSPDAILPTLFSDATRSLGIIPRTFTSGLPFEWTNSTPLVQAALRYAVRIPWDDSDKPRFLASLEHYTTNSLLSVDIARLLVSLGDPAAAFRVLSPSQSLRNPDMHAVRGAAAARVGDRQLLYGELANLNAHFAKNRSGAHPPIISWAHEVIATCSPAPWKGLHRLVSILASDMQLPQQIGRPFL
jgi:hypothetical protein